MVDTRSHDGAPPPTAISPQAFRPWRASLTTDVLPERDRLGYFRDELGRLLNLEVEPLGEAKVHYTIDSVLAGSILVNTMVGSPTHFVRDRRHLRDSDDNFTFVLFERGSQVLMHNGFTTPATGGGAYLIHNGIASESYFPEAEALVKAIRIESKALGTLVHSPYRDAGRSLSDARPALALLRGYLSALGGVGDGMTPELMQNFGMHVVDLVATVIGTTRDGMAQVEQGGLRAARLREVLVAISGRACEPGFTAEVVARELGVTARYVNKLLEETGSTFAEHVLEHRLRRAWRLLCNPACTHKIAAVAYDTGFSDLSTFNRSFRRRFGETPSEVRGSQSAAVPIGGVSRDGLGETATHINSLLLG